MLRLAFAAALVLATAAPAQGPRYLRGAELDVRPAPLGPVEPAAPEMLAAVAGRVVARVLVNEAGSADRVLVESSEPSPLFGEAVVAAFGAARYDPGMKAGRPVKSQMRVEVRF